MDKFIYLLIGLTLLGCSAPLILLRKDLMRVWLKAGIAGGLAGVVGEILYYRDYLRPPRVTGNTMFSPEDFLFGFAITAFSAIAYAVLTRKRFIKGTAAEHRSVYGLFFVFGIVALAILNIWFGVNSIFASSAVIIGLSAIILVLRTDLAMAALFTAVLAVALVVVLYIPLLDVFAPQYDGRYWLLAHTGYGITIFGNVPLTELLWYFAWASFAGISYPFVTGKTLAERASVQRTPKP